MAQAEVRAYIHRDSEDVFAYLTNVHHLPEWSSMVIDVDDVQLATLEQPGTSTTHGKVIGRQLRTTYRLTIQLGTPRAFSLESTSGPIRHTWHYTCTPDGPGTTLTMTLTGDPGRYFRLPAAVVMSMLRRQMQLDVRTLKAFLETTE